RRAAARPGRPHDVAGREAPAQAARSGLARHDLDLLHLDWSARHENRCAPLLGRLVEAGNVGAEQVVEPRDIAVEGRAQLLEARRHDVRGWLRVRECETEAEGLQPIMEAVQEMNV